MRPATWWDLVWMRLDSLPRVACPVTIPFNGVILFDFTEPNSAPSRGQHVPTEEDR